jgi:MSHA pilin protein MshD
MMLRRNARHETRDAKENAGVRRIPHFVPRVSQTGVTLVELVISIVIIAIAASAVLGVLSMLAKGSAEGMIRNQAVAIATAYLEEIRLKTFDADGQEASRGLYDDVSDYNGVVDNGAHDQLGNAITGLNLYRVTITVGPGTLGALSSPNVKRIDVNVFHPNAGVNMTITGYRTRPAP